MTDNAVVPTVYDVKDIMQFIPHRYPFLLVDRIIEITEKTVVALKNVTINEPHFQGHWPDEPVMPGVLQLEAMAQAGAVLLFDQVKKQGQAGKVDIFFRKIDKAVFRKIVRPGDQIIFEIEVLSQRRGIHTMRGEAKVNGEICSEAEMTAVLRAREESEQG
jgi:beta-hydroxyacyl-ACP dehydratase FabZ